MKVTRLLKTFLLLGLFVVYSGSVLAAPPTKPLTNTQKQQLEEAKTLSDRASELKDEGKTEEALEIHKKSLALRIKAVGDDHEDTKASLESIGFLLALHGDRAGSIPYFERVLKIEIKLHGEEADETATAHASLGIIQRLQRDFEPAKKHLKTALAIRQKLYGNEHPDTVSSLDDMGSLSRDLEEYDDAKQFLELALTIRSKVLGESHIETATSHFTLGRVLSDMGDYAGARSSYEKSLKVRKELLGEESVDTASTLADLGLVLKRLAEYDTAANCYEQALVIYKKVLGEGDPQTATLILNLGQLKQEMGDNVTARSYFDQALKICEATLGEDDLTTATVLNNIGFLLFTEGDFKNSKVFHERALKTRRKVAGDESTETAMSLNNLAQVAAEEGDLAKARSYYEQSLAICQKTLGEAHPHTATAFDNLAGLLSSQGDYQPAIEFSLKALEIRKKILGNEHPETATSLNNIGLLLQSRDEYAAARPYFDQALAICRKVLGNEHQQTTTILNNLGALFESQQDFPAAKKCYLEALSNSEKQFGAGHIETATYLNNLGSVSREQGDLAACRSYCERTLAIWRKNFGSEHPSTVVSLNNLATLEAQTEHWDLSAKLTDEARHGIRNHIVRVLPTLSEKQQLMFLEETDAANLHSALTLGLLQKADKNVSALSAGWLLNGKGIAHAALAERALVTRDVQNPKLATAVQELLDVRRKLATVALSSTEAGQEKSRKETLEKLGVQEERLSRQLAEMSGGKTKADSWVELSTIQKALPKDSILVDIARFPIFNFQAKGADEKFLPDHYAAWIVRPSGEVQIIDLGLAEPIDSAVRKVKASIEGVIGKDSPLRKRGEAEALKQTQEELKIAADLVWKPISEKLGIAKNVFLSPDASLWLLPWGALPIADDKFLIEDYSITYLVSGRDVIKAKLAKIQTNPALVVANPDFDLSADKVKKAIATVFPNLNIDDDEQTRSISAISLIPTVLRLPGTAGEAEAIKPSILRYTGVAPQMHSDESALESVFKTVQHPKLVVLSTHGFFLPDQEAKQQIKKSGDSENTVALTEDGKPIENPLLRCGLLFAGCNSRKAKGGDDGILTGMEIVGIDLRGTELVVLSACETGIGQVRNGEGVAGLRQAFQLAGAEAVVATLWQIPDIESARIISDFFNNLANGQSKTEALRSAQLKRIAARRERYGAAHPFFWAAFTLTGQ